MSTRVLIDTSVWIEFFRRSEGALGDTVLQLLDEDRIVLCGMVELELLQGARPREQRMLEDLLGALGYVETDRQDYSDAGQQLARLRRKGITVPASDGLIATLCLRHRCQLLTLDAHFDYFPAVQRLPV
ncbi:MAG: PIN domain-containing protein [Acidobacteriota bacterium]|nr:PIN domain-containing protein [Acidobacteriota bacterium]